MKRNHISFLHLNLSPHRPANAVRQVAGEVFKVVANFWVSNYFPVIKHQIYRLHYLSQYRTYRF